ncbi:MAG: hypothetical protein IPM23_12355 [Candidatus Melainabacteria bacterium]|nr:hypothetical protein [Candidatus Melainabacteria bacterium]
MDLCYRLVLMALVVLVFSCSHAGARGSTAKAGANLSGTYKLKRGACDGILLLKRLSSDKYKFLLNVSWTGANPGQVNVGEDSGEVSLAGGKGSYKSEDYVLTFDCTRPELCSVNCAPPEKFGGLNVNPNGSYRRTSKTPPPDSEFDT